MPKDKINYRATGPRTVLTRQTVQGRAIRWIKSERWSDYITMD